jgi:hypothetical protein
MPSVLFALDEYGIPVQTAQALETTLLPASSLDEVLARLRGANLDAVDLSAFEREILHDVRRTLFPASTSSMRISMPPSPIPR